jgi:hypothetical protein
MKELDLPPEEHIAQMVDTHYGPSGGIKVECSCNAYWVVPQPTGTTTIEQVVEQSIKNHIGSLKRPATKPD